MHTKLCPDLWGAEWEINEQIIVHYRKVRKYESEKQREKNHPESYYLEHSLILI